MGDSNSTLSLTCLERLVYQFLMIVNLENTRSSGYTYSLARGITNVGKIIRKQCGQELKLQHWHTGKHCCALLLSQVETGLRETQGLLTAHLGNFKCTEVTINEGGSGRKWWLVLRAMCVARWGWKAEVLFYIRILAKVFAYIQVHILAYSRVKGQ